MRVALALIVALAACDQVATDPTEASSSSSDDGAREDARAEQVAMIIDRCNDVLWCLVECEQQGTWPHPGDPACRVECSEPADEQCPVDDPGQWCATVLDVVDDVIDTCRAGEPCSCYQGSAWDAVPE